MRLASIGMTAAVLLAVAPTGCATVIGLDSGHSLDDDGGDPDAANADASSSDSGTEGDVVTLACAPNTADCNGLSSDGCETMLGTPQHCGGCTDVCLPTQQCKAAVCCLAANQVCVRNEDCCSGQCQDEKCKGGGPGG